MLAKQLWASELAWTEARGVSSGPSHIEPYPTHLFLSRQCRGVLTPGRCRLEAKATHRPHTGCRGRKGSCLGSSRQWGARAEGRAELGTQPHAVCASGGPSVAPGAFSPLGLRCPKSCYGVSPLPAEQRNCPGYCGPSGQLAHNIPPGQTGWLGLARPWSHGDYVAQASQTVPVWDEQSGLGIPFFLGHSEVCYL